MPLQPFDELERRLRDLKARDDGQLRDAVRATLAEACGALACVHAAHVAGGELETGAELLALVDAQTRLLAAAEGKTVELACDALTEPDVGAYDRELTKLAPVIDVIFRARFREAWSPPGLQSGGQSS
jgi:hypothetical protein